MIQYKRQVVLSKTEPDKNMIWLKPPCKENSNYQLLVFRGDGWTTLSDGSQGIDLSSLEVDYIIDDRFPGFPNIKKVITLNGELINDWNIVLPGTKISKNNENKVVTITSNNKAICDIGEFRAYMPNFEDITIISNGIFDESYTTLSAKYKEEGSTEEDTIILTKLGTTKQGSTYYISPVFFRDNRPIQIYIKDRDYCGNIFKDAAGLLKLTESFLGYVFTAPTAHYDILSDLIELGFNIPIIVDKNISGLQRKVVYTHCTREKIDMANSQERWSTCPIKIREDVEPHVIITKDLETNEVTMYLG